MLKATILAIAFFLNIPQLYATETRHDLIIVQGQSKFVLKENDFRQLHLDSIVVLDPVYKKHKRYAGYWLADILALEDIHLDPKTVWTFKALDGYKANIAVADVEQSGAKAFVAVSDLDQEEGWEKIPHGKEFISPGPYYLVWQYPMDDVVPSIKLPWPYQVIEISIHKPDEAQQKIFPDSNDKTDSIKRGYKVFQNNCMACHSINLEGGAVGPELNVPKNILDYENRNFLKSFIKNPSSYRARSKMPTFNKILTDQDVDDVLDYITWIGKHKIQNVQ